MRIAALDKEDLGAVSEMVSVAFPYDRAALVLGEKLLDSNGARPGTTLVAWSPAQPVGLISLAGRWIKLMAVDPAWRDRGIGYLLLDVARSWVRTRGGGRLRLMDHPGNYLTPGLDVRDEYGRSWLARRGFLPVSENVNLRVPLVGNPKVSDMRLEELTARINARGYSLRRVRRADQAAVLKLASDAFSTAWAFELGRAIERDPPCVFAAFKDGQPVAFAAHDANNSGLGWFGPAGTLVTHRGQGIGEALLCACLLDVREAPEGGVIAWIGPRSFYEKTVGAREDRRFIVYEEGPAP